MRTLIALALLLTMVVAGHAPVAGAEASPSPQSSPAAELPAANPICAQAFAVAEAEAELAETPAASPSASLTPTVGPGDRLDGAIRACGSLIDWTLAGLAHPEALLGADPLLHLIERCTDSSAGLEAYATCESMVGALATPEPTATPMPTATPAPTPTPTARPSSGTASSPRVGKDGLVRLPRKLKVNVPDATKIRYFKVFGKSANELFRQTKRRTKPRCAGGEHAIACVDNRWRIVANQSSGGASCTIASVGWTLTSVVHAPRWTGPKRVEPELLEWWRKVLRRVSRHEEHHIKIQRAHLGRLRAALVGKPCSAFNRENKRYLKRSRRAQAAFDKKESTKPFPPGP